MKMRSVRLYFGTGGASAPRATVLLAVLGLFGCSGGPAPEKKAPEKIAISYFHPDPATAATIHGSIKYEGPAPPRKLIDMDADAGCSADHKGKPVYFEPLVTGKKSALVNAFVYIKTGLEEKKFEPPKEQAVLDQHGCLFVPRVLGMQTSQILDLKNSDNVAHNIHPMPKNNYGWNQEQPPHAPDADHRFPHPEVMIAVKCSIHAWMRCWVGVVEHPYFAVTDGSGNFEWKNVPPGDYTVTVWHEQLGEQSQQVHVAASGDAAVNFTYR